MSLVFISQILNFFLHLPLTPKYVHLNNPIAHTSALV